MFPLRYNICRHCRPSLDILCFPALHYYSLPFGPFSLIIASSSVVVLLLVDDQVVAAAHHPWYGIPAEQINNSNG